MHGIIFNCVYILDASVPLGSPRQTHSGHSLSTSAKTLSNAQKILEADEFGLGDHQQGLFNNLFFL